MSQVPTFARQEGTGKLVINPRKLDVQTFFLRPDLPNSPIVVPAGGTSGPIGFTVSQDGPFEGFYLTATRDNATDVFVDIYDEGLRRHLMNRECHIDTVFGFTIAGTGIGPHMLAESLWLHPSRSLIVQMRDVVGGAGNNVFPVITGVRFYGYSNPSKELALAMEKRSARSRVSTPYFLTTDDTVQIGAVIGTTAQAFLTVAAEGHFEWWKTSFVSDGAFLIEFFDPRNGRSLSNGPVHSDTILGTGAFPFINPESNLFQANGQIRIVLTNQIAGANDVHLTLSGRRIYVR